MQANLYYCEQKIAPPGSDWYYALLDSNETHRNSILALLTLNAEWQAILQLSHEPMLQQAKFTWWQEELVNTFDNHQPQHPATQLLYSAILAQESFLGEHLKRILSAYQDKQQPIFYISEADWLNQPLAKENIYSLIAELLSSDLAITYLEKLAYGSFLCNNILYLREYLKVGQIPFSQETLNKHQVDLHQLQQLKASENLQKLLQDQWMLAQKTFSDLFSQLSTHQKKQQKPLQRFVQLQQKLICEIAKENFPVLTRQITLTPIRKLLICWFDIK